MVVTHTREESIEVVKRLRETVTVSIGGPPVVGVRLVLRKSGRAGRGRTTNWRFGATGGGMLRTAPSTRQHIQRASWFVKSVVSLSA